jgi:hypothetical protein
MHIAEAMEEIQEEDNDATASTCNAASAWLLILSATMFLVFSALVHSMTNAMKEMLIRQRYLVSIRLLVSLLCAALHYLPASIACVGYMPVATFMVPILFFVSACVEVWGLQERGYSVWEKYRRQSSIQRIKPLQKRRGNRKLLVMNMSDDSILSNTAEVMEEDVREMGPSPVRMLVSDSFDPPVGSGSTAIHTEYEHQLNALT